MPPFVYPCCRRGLPAEVVRRVESGRFAVDVHVLDVYVRALVALRRVNEADAPHLLERLTRALEGSHSGIQVQDVIRQVVQSGPSSSAAASAPSAGPQSFVLSSNRSSPLLVEVVPPKPSWWFVALRIAGFGLTAYVLYVIVYKSAGSSPLAQLTGGDHAEEVTDIPDVRFADVKVRQVALAVNEVSRVRRAPCARPSAVHTRIYVSQIPPPPQGVDEAKKELEDIVEYLRDPEKFKRLGAKVPRGVLLTGPPGTGKTLLARAVAGEAGCKFYSKSASEFEEMLVGLGARRVRDLFTAARKNPPAIIFIDEIDALGGKRKMSVGGGAERQTLNQLLSCMDGFTKNDNIIVIGAVRGGGEFLRSRS